MISRGGRDQRVTVRVELERFEHMFEMAPVDFRSALQRYETGIDYCISELRSQRSMGPVQLEIAVAESNAEAVELEQFRAALWNYCQQRMDHNHRERRASRGDGYAALRLGLPVAMAGLAIAALTEFAWTKDNTALPNLVGWVLAWGGLWYPMDALLFSAIVPDRENLVLSRLLKADVVVVPLVSRPDRRV